MRGGLITLAKEIHFHMLEELVANPEMILLSSEEEVGPALLMVALSRVHKMVGWRVLRYLSRGALDAQDVSLKPL
jgi:hypothetical protein